MRLREKIHNWALELWCGAYIGMHQKYDEKY
jgi:hypothetical protein